MTSESESSSLRACRSAASLMRGERRTVNDAFDMVGEREEGNKKCKTLYSKCKIL